MTSEVVLTIPVFIRGNADLELVSYGGYLREKSPRSHNTESQTGSQISNSCSCPQQHLEVPPPLFRSLKNTLRSLLVVGSIRTANRRRMADSIIVSREQLSVLNYILNDLC